MPRGEEHLPSLPHIEVASALAKVEESGASMATKLCLRFVVLTTMRSGEARSATWSEIDLEDKEWRIAEPESTERSEEGTGTGHNKDGETTDPEDMGRAGPAAGLLPVRGASHDMAEGSRDLSLPDSCGTSVRDIRLTGG